jgi:hypothetical protein
MRMSYEEAVDRGYDGPDPFTEQRKKNSVKWRTMLDPRDPDYLEDEADEEQDDE